MYDVASLIVELSSNPRLLGVSNNSRLKTNKMIRLVTALSCPKLASSRSHDLSYVCDVCVDLCHDCIGTVH